MDNESILSQLYCQSVGSMPSKVERLAGAGSNRSYYRLSGERSLIGVIGTNLDENRAFITIDKHFKAKGLPVPTVHAVSDDEMAYLQDDLGSTALFDLIANGRTTGNFSDDEIALLSKAIRLLPKVQFEGADGLDFSVCFPCAELDEQAIMWDLNYFKYCFLKASGLEFSEGKLEQDFRAMCKVLLKAPTGSFLYRDFQSRNVMICDGEPFLIDFQGGRKGPFYYDVASFLWQAKANLSHELRMKLAKEYVEALQPYYKISCDDFLAELRHYVLFRTLQVLGAYGFRGYFEKKPHFLESIPFAIENLRQLLKEPYEEYPYLTSMLQELTELKQFNTTDETPALTVKVMSFAYPKGIPADESGNGGGFVFDCRAIHNPGRYDAYKPYTGMDQCVIKFLEDDGEITDFLEHVYAIVDASVSKYIKRGFSSLMICFGCTGGQHRSVYGAQHTAEHIFDKFKVNVELLHREQNVSRTYKPLKPKK